LPEKLKDVDNFRDPDFSTKFVDNLVDKLGITGGQGRTDKALT
jgi:hypothetical protein